MGHIHILPGNITALITAADIPAFLNTLTDHDIDLQNLSYCDDLSVRISFKRKNYDKMHVLAEKHGVVVKVLGVSGILLSLFGFRKRPVLLTFLLLVFLLACFIPSRIFFISVEGNASVPEKYILEVAAECGIDFGAKRRLVRSEMMKNRLLERIPQLQWAGINTSGCTAVISVREKTAQEKLEVPQYAVSSIVAARDGIIQSCTVLQGNTLCAVGQAVKAGQILVSGYLDCGIVTKTTTSDAEIKALTFRELKVFTPNASIKKGMPQESRSRYALRIGKKLIKFYKDSGNLDTTCGKIYSEEYVYLPGGFRLPFAFVKETEIQYALRSGEPAISDNGEWLRDFSKSYLIDNMISGEIISADSEVNPVTDGYYFYGKYACTEMIGQIKYEQTIPKDDVKWQNGS